MVCELAIRIGGAADIFSPRREAEIERATLTGEIYEYTPQYAKLFNGDLWQFERHCRCI
jgi:hypothetical protein